MVIDFCMKIPEKKVHEYFEQWNHMRENKKLFTDAERERIENENPIEFAFHPTAEVNGKQLDWSHGNGCWYNCHPGEDEENDPESEAWMKHYQLDRSCCWRFTRYYFPWATKRRPEIRELWVELEADAISWSGEPFTVSEPNEVVKITHPTTGEEYTLKVLDLQPETLSEQQLLNGFVCPKYLWTIRYALDPELPRNTFALQDCAPSDKIRKAPAEQRTENADIEAETISIIGGADGPTAVLFTRSDKDTEERADCSSLHFEPAATVTWKPVFRVKPYKNIRICLG